MIDDVVSIEQDENGITSLNNKYKADLYIDLKLDLNPYC